MPAPGRKARAGTGVLVASLVRHAYCTAESRMALGHPARGRGRGRVRLNSGPNVSAGPWRTAPLGA
ncbi:MAG TPA: hypothetical protein VFZ21_07335 [Gemmatimonadaceae bacterium]|nr:hypothetical protein [Gemmatimonadaceae bacterium]